MASGIVQRDTGHVVAHVQHVQWDPMTPIVIGYNNYEGFSELTVEEAKSLVFVLEEAINAIEGA